MASLNSIIPQSFLSLSTPKLISKPTPIFPHINGLSGSSLPCFRISLRNRQSDWAVVGSVSEEFDVIPVSGDSTDQLEEVVDGLEREIDGGGDMVDQVVGGFGSEGRLSFEGAGEFQEFSLASSSGVLIDCH